MKIDRIQPLIPKTANLLSLPTDKVATVVAHQFKTLKDHFVDPPDITTVQLDFLGKFRGNWNMIHRNIQRVISYLRKDPNNEALKKRFRKYWRIRRFLQKERTRRNFKKRFNGWYY